MVDQTPISLYLHIPFCRHRCSYCDFNTYTTLAELRAAYTVALSQEITQVGDLGIVQGRRPPVHTIYFGGGTPSLMSLDMLERILASARRAFELVPLAEITLEANPGTVDQAYLKGLWDIGINRLSFGAQSAVPSELALLEREHDFSEVTRAAEMSRTAGIANINLDLIYGVPGQTISSWEESLRATLALEPAHLSLYCLTIEPGTPMDRWLRNGRISPTDADLAADQYELACDLLSERGFEHYEISNWSLPGRACRHNLTYWRNQTYLGMGAGAHGHARGCRYHNVRQPRVYIRRMESGEPGAFPVSAAVAERHVVGREEAMSDVVITQLRLLEEGLDLAAFQGRFGQSLNEAYDGTVSQLIEWDLLEQDDDRLRLTRRGRFLSNQVFYRFL